MSVSCLQLAGNVWVISTRGRLDQSTNPQLEQSLKELLDKGHDRFIVDMTEATYINSGGLRCLVSAWRRTQEQGGDLVLCGLNPRLEEIFSLIGFDRVFHIYATYEDAQKHDYT